MTDLYQLANKRGNRLDSLSNAVRPRINSNTNDLFLQPNTFDSSHKLVSKEAYGAESQAELEAAPSEIFRPVEETMTMKY